MTQKISPEPDSGANPVLNYSSGAPDRRRSTTLSKVALASGIVSGIIAIFLLLDSLGRYISVAPAKASHHGDSGSMGIPSIDITPAMIFSCFTTIAFIVCVLLALICGLRGASSYASDSQERKHSIASCVLGALSVVASIIWLAVKCV